MFLVAFIYLSIPVFIILFTFFSATFVGVSMVALLILVFCLHQSCKSEQDISPHNTYLLNNWPLLIISLIITFVCITMPFDDDNWIKQYAILNFLSENSWPPVIELDEQKWFMRYYCAWHIVPTLFAKLFGAQLLVPAMFIWTTAGLFIALVLVFHKFHKVKYLVISSLVFFLFSGLDFVGALLTNYAEGVHTFWLQGYAGERIFTIFASLTSLQIAPQHATVGFLTTSLFLYNQRLAVKYGAVILVLAVLWSPFCTIGLLPIALWALIREGYKVAFNLQNIVIAPLLAIPILAYMTQRTGNIPTIFIWNDGNFILFSAIVFYIFEFILILSVFYIKLKEERLLIAILAVFFSTLCLFKVGVHNDLVGRGSIPAVCVMSILIVQTILKSKGWSRELLVLYLLVGAFPVIAAFGKSLSQVLPRSERNITLVGYLDTYKSPDGGESYREQYLVETTRARYIFTIPLMRTLR